MTGYQSQVLFDLVESPFEGVESILDVVPRRKGI